MPTLCLSSFGTLDRWLSFTPPPPPDTQDTVRQCMVHMYLTILSLTIAFIAHRRAVCKKMHFQIELLACFSAIKHFFFFYRPISPFHWILCQICWERRGQIHPHSPQLALTPVTRVSGRGRRFHAGCTICPVFTLLSICITDSRPEWHQHEATVTECYRFFRRLAWKSSSRLCA